MLQRKLSRFLLALIVFLPLGCSTSPSFDLKAYEQALTLKAESLSLMDKADSPYSEHKTEVAKLILRINEAYEYAKGRPKNERAIRQWAIIKDPNNDSLGSFLNFWEKESRLPPAFVREMKKTISGSFDGVIQLEGGRQGTKGVLTLNKEN